MIALAAHSVSAATVYWDTNGATPGGGNVSGFANGTWAASTIANWTLDSTGSTGTTTYDVANGGDPANADVVFSAGTDATTFGNVTVSGNVTARSITIEERMSVTATASGPGLYLGNGGLTLNNTVVGNTSFLSSLPVYLNDSQTWTNNSTGLLSVASTIAGTATTGNTQTLTISGTGNQTYTGAINTGFNGGNVAVIIDAGPNAIVTWSNPGNFSAGLTLISGKFRPLAGGATSGILGAGNVTFLGGEVTMVRSANSNPITYTNPFVTVAGNVSFISDVGGGSTGVTYTVGTNLTIGNNAIVNLTPGTNVTTGTAGLAFGATTINGNFTVNSAAATNVRFGALSDNGTAYVVNKVGVGNLTFANTPTSFVAGMTLNIREGAVILGGNATIGNSNTTVNLGDAAVGADVTLRTEGSQVPVGTFTLNIIGGAGTRTVSINSGGSGSTDTNFNANTILQNKDVAFTGVATHSNGSYIFTGGLSGTGNATFNNTGTKTLIVQTTPLNNNGSVTNIGVGGVSFVGAFGATLKDVVQNATGNMGLSGTNTGFTGNITAISGIINLNGSTATSINNVVYIGAAGNLSVQNSSVIAGLNDYNGQSGNVSNFTGTNRALTMAGSGNYSYSGQFSANILTTNNTLQLVKGGLGFQTFSGASTTLGQLTVNGGTLRLDATGAGSYGNVSLSISRIFEYYNASGAARSQNLGILTMGNNTTTLTGQAANGAATVQSTVVGVGSSSALNFGSINTTIGRSAGNTLNFVVSGGTNGTTNGIYFGNVTTGFVDRGVYFNGADFAWTQGNNSFVRAVAYGSDANFVNAGATLANSSTTHYQLSSTIATQAAASVATLKIAGSGAVDITMAANGNLTLSSGGLIRSGGGSTTFTSSGTGGLSIASNGEYVVRTDTTADNITFNGSVRNVGSNRFTKTGAGNVTFNNANTYTGITAVLEGRLQVNNAGTLGSGNVVIGQVGTLNLAGTTANTAIADTANTTNGNLTIQVGGVLDIDTDETINVVVLGSSVFNTPTFFGSANNYGGFGNTTGFFAGSTATLTITPEPTSLGLIGLGATGLLARRRRRGK